MVASLLLLIILSLIGIADASYITYEEFSGRVPPCVQLPMFDCNSVLQSAWSHLGPIPLSLFGIGFYGLVFVLATYSLVVPKPHRYARLALVVLGAWGFLFSAYLFYVQAFILLAFCSFCLLSATTSTLIFAISWWHFAATKEHHA